MGANVEGWGDGGVVGGEGGDGVENGGCLRRGGESGDGRRQLPPSLRFFFLGFYFFFFLFFPFWVNFSLISFLCLLYFVNSV